MYSDYLSIFDTSVYKYIGENKEYLRRCRQVSKDTIFVIEHKKLTQWIDFVIIKSTSHNNIKNGKFFTCAFQVHSMKCEILTIY